MEEDERRNVISRIEDVSDINFVLHDPASDADLFKVPTIPSREPSARLRESQLRKEEQKKAKEEENRIQPFKMEKGCWNHSRTHKGLYCAALSVNHQPPPHKSFKNVRFLND